MHYKVCPTNTVATVKCAMVRTPRVPRPHVVSSGTPKGPDDGTYVDTEQIKSTRVMVYLSGERSINSEGVLIVAPISPGCTV